MLIRSTNEIAPDFFLINLGTSCLYLLKTGAQYCLFDCATSAELPVLLKLLNELKISVNQINKLFITHTDVERVGSIAKLLELNPSIEILLSPHCGTKLTTDSSFKELLRSDLELGALLSKQDLNSSHTTLSSPTISVKQIRPIHDGDIMKLQHAASIHVLAANGHAQGSLAYLILPHQILVTDESTEYFRGRLAVGPAGDHNLTDLAQTLDKFLNLELKLLCLPYAGALTGKLIRRHLEALRSQSQHLIKDLKEALSDQTDGETEIEKIKEAVKQALWDQLYSPESSSPILLSSLKRSFEAVWKQACT